MYNFYLTEKQQQKLNDWILHHEDVYTGAIGGRYTYEFTPTSIGIAVWVRDAITKEKIDLSDYEDW